MRRCLLAIISTFLFLATGMSLQAETDLTGTWTGQFDGVFTSVPEIPQGMFSSRPYEEVRKVEPTPEFMKIPVTASIEKQQGNLLYGYWAIQEDQDGLKPGDYFVCTMTDPHIWSCVDPGGSIRIEEKSATEMEMCYLGTNGYGQGAGCAMLKKSQ